MSWQEAKDRLADADPGALFALGFVALVFVLSVYAWRHWAKRKEALLKMMPRLGFHEVSEPAPEDWVPESLFHPNEFEAPERNGPYIQDLRSRVPLAWRGQLGDWPVTIMDVSISRMRGGNHHVDETRQISFNRKVLRCSPNDLPGQASELPPDLLIREHVLFKGQVRHQRSVDGVDLFGEHYMLFSEAPEAQLATWLTPALQAALGRHRLWSLAVHGGVVFLCRGSSREEPHEMESFMREGGELLSVFLERPSP